MPLFLSGNSGSATLDSSNGLIYPTWTTAGRPASPATGQCGYNTTIGGVEIYNGSAWDCITGGPAFYAYQSASGQSITTSTYTKIVFDTKAFDTANAFDNTTNYRFQPTVAGYYQFNAVLTPSSATSYTIVRIYKNGSAYFSGGAGNNITNSPSSVSGILYMNGSTDYVEIYGYLTGTTPTVFNNSYSTYFNGALIRSA